MSVESAIPLPGVSPNDSRLWPCVRGLSLIGHHLAPKAPSAHLARKSHEASRTHRPAEEAPRGVPQNATGGVTPTNESYSCTNAARDRTKGAGSFLEVDLLH